MAPQRHLAPVLDGIPRLKLSRRPILRRAAAFTLGIPTLAKVFRQHTVVAAYQVNPSPPEAPTRSESRKSSQIARCAAGSQASTPFSASGLRGQHQIIGIIDIGILNLDHCWFRDNVHNTPGPTHRKVVGCRDRSKAGDSIHTAFVAGIIAGDDVGNPGAAPNRGIACEARLTYGNCKDFLGASTPATLYDYLKEALNDGAHIHNLSWHVTAKPQYSQDACDVDTFVWDHEECLVVCSSGNSGEELGPPGTAKNALCVSAAYVDGGESCLGDGVPGPTEDGRRKPDLLAPGCDIISADAGSTCSTKLDATLGAAAPPIPVCASEPVFCAASFAAPVVSAAAAIVRQYFVEGWHPSGKPRPEDTLIPSGALLKAVLLNSARKTSYGAAYPGDEEGWGLLQLDRVLSLGRGSRNLWIADVRNTNGLCTGEISTHALKINTAREPLRVTLVWSEPPGQAKSTDPVVNNLDLEVTSPNGSETYRGNCFANGVSTTGGSPDPRNNVEMVLVHDPAPGAWTITVRATEVNVGNAGQGYALVVTADLSTSSPL